MMLWVTQDNDSIDLSSIDPVRVVKTAVQAGLGTAIPQFGEGAGNAVDALATSLLWAEASTMIVSVDIVVTTVLEEQHSTQHASVNGRCQTMSQRELMIM